MRNEPGFDQAMVLRVYVAEDDSALQRALVEMIGEVGGTEVVGMADGVGQARTGVADLCPDVLVTDLNMCDGTALNLLQEAPAAMRVIVVSSLPCTPGHARRLRAAGADWIVDKLGDVSALIGILDALKTDIHTPGGSIRA